MRRFTYHSTPEPDVLLSRLANVHPAGPGRWMACCPACGRALPEEPERYTLRRDGVPAVYCPTCGAEWGVPHA